ncbi:MAG: oligosaccharide flippase family protein [Patescibacteria group bacterium]
MSDRKNFFYYLLPSIVSSLVGIATIPITTYFLDPKDFGVYAILSAFVMPVVALSTTGVSWVLGGHFYKTEGDDNRSLIFNILFFDFIFKSFWILLLWFLSPLLLPWLVNGYQAGYSLFFKLSLVTILLSTFTASISYALVLKREAKKHAVVEITGPIVSATVTILCLYVLKLTTISLFLGPLGAEIASVLIGLWFVRNSIKINLDKKWFREIIKVGLPSMPLELVNLLSNISDKYFVQRFMNLSSLGIYSHSTNYKSVFSLGFKAFNRVFAPHVLEGFSNENEIKIAKLKKQLVKWIGLAGIGGIFVSLFSKEVVNILSHGKFIEAAPLVPLWYLLIFFMGFGTTYQQFLFVRKKSLYLTISGVFTGVISIGLIALGAAKFGMMGAVVAALLANLVTQLSFKIYARKLGCASMGESRIFAMAASVFLVYLANILVDFNLISRVIIAVLLSVVVAIVCGLHKTQGTLEN